MWSGFLVQRSIGLPQDLEDVEMTSPVPPHEQGPQGQGPQGNGHGPHENGHGPHGHGPGKGLCEFVRITAEDITQRLDYLKFTGREAKLLKGLRDWTEGVADAFMTQLYDYQFANPEFIKMVNRAGATRQQIQQQHRAYFVSLFDGMPDMKYVEGRFGIGRAHARLGITPQWFVSTYQLYSLYFYPMIRRRFRLRPWHAVTVIDALEKLINFDMQLVLEIYVLDVSMDLKKVGTRAAKLIAKEKEE